MVISARHVNHTNTELGLSPNFVPDESANCMGPSFCLSGVCSNGSCTAPSCTDRVFNEGFETDLDCGGLLCPFTCLPGEACIMSRDCSQNGTCVDSRCKVEKGVKCSKDLHCLTNHCDPDTLACSYRRSCFNRKQDGNETDIDCGGKHCPPCSLGRQCIKDGDCKSKNCLQDRCVEPTPTPTATPSVTPTATVGTSPSNTQTATPSVTGTPSVTRTPGPSVILSLFAPNMPSTHNGVTEIAPFTVIASFNIEIERGTALDTRNFTEVCMELFEGSWEVIRDNLTYSFTARILTGCYKDATLTLPLFTASRTHDFSATLVAEFIGGFSPTPYSTPSTTVTASPSPTSPPLRVSMYALTSSPNLPISTEPLTFVLKSSHPLDGLNPSIFNVTIDNPCQGDQRVFSVSKIDSQEEHMWLVKLEHLCTGRVTVTIPRYSLKDERGMYPDTPVTATAWFDGTSPHLSLVAPIEQNEHFTDSSLDIFLLFDKEVNMTDVDFPIRGRRLSHAEPKVNIENGVLLWVRQVRELKSEKVYFRDGSSRNISQSLASRLATKAASFADMYHAYVDVSDTKEDTIEIEFFPALFRDRAGNTIAHKRTFSFVRDVIPPQLNVDVLSVGFPQSKINLSAHEEFSVDSQFYAEYRIHQCFNLTVCPEFEVLASLDSTSVPGAGTNDYFELPLPVDRRPDSAMISIYVNEGSVSDVYGIANPNVTISPVLDLRQYGGLVKFSAVDDMGNDGYFELHVTLNFTTMDDLASPRLEQFLDIVASASEMLDFDSLYYQEVQENGEVLILTLLHDGLSASSTGELQRRELTEEDDLVSRLTDQLRDLPLALMQAGFVQNISHVLVGPITAKNVPQEGEPSAAEDILESDTIAVVSGMSALLFLLVAIWLVVRRYRKSDNEKRQRRLQEYGSDSSSVPRLIDDTTIVDEDTGHGTALNTDEAQIGQDGADSLPTGGRMLEGHLRSEVMDSHSSSDSDDEDTGRSGASGLAVPRPLGPPEHHFSTEDAQSDS